MKRYGSEERLMLE